MMKRLAVSPAGSITSNPKGKEEALPRPVRAQTILWVLGILVGLGMMIYNYPKFQVGAHYDDAAYITLARSFLQGSGYGLINFPGEPRIANYPFGYPLVLSLIAAFSPNELASYKLVSIIATLINASLIFWGWRWLSRNLSHWWALAVSLLYLFSPVTIDLSGRVMSEPLFLTLYLLAMMLTEWGCKGQFRYKIFNWLWPLGLGMLLVMIPFVRSIGIAITAGILLYLIIVKRKKFLSYFGGVLAGMAVTVILVVTLTPVNWPDLFPTKYLSDQQAAFLIGLLDPFHSDTGEQPAAQTATQAEELITQRGLRGLLYDYLFEGSKEHFGKSLRTAVFPFAGTSGEQAFALRIGIPFLPVLLGYLISGTIIFGYYRWVKAEHLTVFILSSIVYFIALFAWIWDEPRFLNPIAAQLLTAFLLGVSGILLLAARGWQRLTRQDYSHFLNPVLVAFTCLLLLLSLYKSVTISDSRIHIGELYARTAWLRQHTSQEAIFMSEYPVIDYLYSNRLTTSMPLKEISPAELFTFLKQKNIDYILLAPQIAWMKPKFEPRLSQQMTALLPQFEALEQAGQIQIVYQEPDSMIKIYQVR